METSSQKKIHWLRLWTKGWLEGSIRFDLTPAQRSVFIDLCAMARQSRNPPMVQANETTPYPHSWLANKLNIPLELLEETLKLCEEQERISENSSGIRIIKFEEYQAPIGKQEPRQEKGTGKKIRKVCPTCDYKALTNEEYCPKCLENGKDILLQRDYKGQKYGHMVQE